MMKDMDKARIRVDFNELVQPNVVLLSQADLVVDSRGTEVPLTEGLPVSIYEYNDYADGEQEYLLADGVAELNDTAVNGLWCKQVKWCCRIDERGIRIDDGSIWP
jgi:hypothetical protein